MCMYTFLPAMKHCTPELLKRAMDEMAEMYRHDQTTLSQQFVWMQLLLERSDMLPLPEKVKVKEQFSMYDPLWENHPKIKQIRAESRAEGRAEGEAKGEILTAQRMFVNIVKARFPALGELAQKEAARISNPESLDLLAQKVVTAPDENIARWLLTPPAA